MNGTITDWQHTRMCTALLRALREKCDFQVFTWGRSTAGSASNDTYGQTQQLKSSLQSLQGGRKEWTAACCPLASPQAALGRAGKDLLSGYRYALGSEATWRLHILTHVQGWPMSLGCPTSGRSKESHLAPLPGLSANSSTSKPAFPTRLLKTTLDI